MSTATTNATSAYQPPSLVLNPQIVNQSQAQDVQNDSGFLSARVSPTSMHDAVGPVGNIETDSMQFLLDNKEIVLKTLHDK